MYKIVKAKQLASSIIYFDVEAPRVAASCLPGQFVIVRMDEKGEYSILGLKNSKKKLKLF